MKSKRLYLSNLLNTDDAEIDIHVRYIRSLGFSYKKYLNEHSSSSADSRRSVLSVNDDRMYTKYR